jgi:riboflavin synthase
MFTGLIQDVGIVERVTAGGLTDLWIRTSLGAGEFEHGESIAVDGVCLTVVEQARDRFRVQAAPETLRRSTLGELTASSRVNLERALRLSDRLGGHLVQGHVDAVTSVLDWRSEGDSRVLSFVLPEALRPFLVEKGSVALDGISLTVMDLTADRFRVMLIPETQHRTTLGQKAVGARVNVEADLIGKYVARLYALGRGAGGGGVSRELLERSGFTRGGD